MILAIFRLISNHIELRIMLVSRIDRGRWLIIFWFIASKYNRWALIGAWAAIRTNVVNEHACSEGKTMAIQLHGYNL